MHERSHMRGNKLVFLKFSCSIFSAFSLKFLSERDDESRERGDPSSLPRHSGVGVSGD